MRPLFFLIFCGCAVHRSNGPMVRWSFCWDAEPRATARIFLGSKGNRSLHAPTLYFACLLAGPVVWMHVYYMLQQTYVLHVDTFLNAVSVGFVGTQFLLGAFAATGFPKDGNGGGKSGAAPRRVAGVSYVGAGAVPAAAPAAPTFVVGAGGGSGAGR